MHAILQGARLACWVAAPTAVLFAGALVVMGLIGAAAPAAAQQGFGNLFGYETPRPQKRRAARRRSAPSDEQAAETTDGKKADKSKESGETAPKGPVYVVISLGDQHVSVYDSTGRIARSRVSTGMPGFPTPIGVFSVIGKERWHRSNIYSGAPMPWMQRVTWSGVAMHAGVVPGYPASHGCIRLPYSFAPQLWGLTKMGARVVIARRDTVPFDFAHAFLPLPKMQPAPATTMASEQASPASRRPEAPIELASMSPHVGVSTAAVSDAPGPSAGAQKVLNPIAYAEALKERAKADKAAADTAAKDALAAAQAVGADARQAVEDVRKAGADLKGAEVRLAELESPAPASPAPAKKPGDAPEAGSAEAAAAAEAAAVAKTAAQSELIRARAALEEAQRREATKTPAAFAAVEAWKRAVAASEKAAKTLAEADRRIEPVSVLISRKEGRIFIRQDWKEVYEAPVTIRDPDKPLGTHVYIAVATEPDGSAMRWSAMSIPEASGDERRKRSKKEADAPAPQVSAAPETAAGALDRIELPPGARERIAELLWTGASLIVSDHPRSDEMSEYTDFMIMTR